MCTHTQIYEGEASHMDELFTMFTFATFHYQMAETVTTHDRINTIYPVILTTLIPL